MPHVFIQPPEKPSSTTTTQPALINLAVELGEFKAITGVVFDVEPHDRLTLRVTYWQDETFIALRLKFGHLFVPEPKMRQPLSSIIGASQGKPRKTRYPYEAEIPVGWKDEDSWESSKKTAIWQESIDKYEREQRRRVQAEAEAFKKTVREAEKAAERDEPRSMIYRLSGAILGHR